MEPANLETARLAYSKTLRLVHTICITIASLTALVIIYLSLPLLGLLSSGENVMSYNVMRTLGPVMFLAVWLIAAPLTLMSQIPPSTKTYKTYQAAYKQAFLHKALSTKLTNYQYSPQIDAATFDEFHKINLIETGSSSHTNDFIRGSYKGIPFYQFDVEIIQWDNDSTVTIMKGRYMVFQFKKKINSRLMLIGHQFNAAKKQVPIIDLFNVQDQGAKIHRSKFRPLELESPAFNHEFKTSAEDGFDAFYILDPTFLEKATSLSQLHKGRIFIGFYEDKMLVAIDDRKDSFEPPSPNHPIDETVELQKITSELELVTSIVDHLALASSHS